MRCPDCRGRVVFGKQCISCASCGWRPSELVQMNYAWAPWTNRKIAFSSLSLSACVALFGLLTESGLLVVIGICLGVSVAAVSLIARDAVVKWMIRQAEATEQ
ncbi:TPA: hypothetical protein HA259_08100 [Thermoplasmata archaeon]|nr:hypothetical protein [Thermoplasmata archaeon]